jgi:hypothetical protein
LNISFTDNYKKSWETKVYARENMIALEMILAKSSKGKSFIGKKKQERVNIEEINDDNVNRDFRQEEVQPGMHADMMIKHTTHIDSF